MHMQETLLSRLSLAILTAVLGAYGWHILGSLLHRFFLRKLTVLLDIKNIGQPRFRSRRIKGTAIICGGSIAGLWAARICADHFEEVLIIEPEAWLDTEEGMTPIYDRNGLYIESRRTNTRTRVEQYTATHVFQPLALQALRKLFPNFDETVRNFGGRIADAEFNVHAFGGQLLRLPRQEYAESTVPQYFFMSRESYERMLRGLVRGSSGRIKWASGTVIGLKALTGDSTVLTSVTVRHPCGIKQDVTASLVVDCTGRSQAGVKWLNRLHKEHKYETYGREWEHTTGIVRLDYNTKQRFHTFRFYVPPEARSRLPIPGGYEHGAPCIYTFMPRPGVERKYFLVDKVDGHRLELGFGGWGEPPLPTNFLEIRQWLENFEADVPVPSWLLGIIDVLLEYKDLARVEELKFPDFSWVRYDQAPEECMPSNFVAVGDSVMVVNPTFGQGCTKACIGAVTLDSLLRSEKLEGKSNIPKNFGHDFFKLHTDRIRSAWNGSKPTDYQWDTTRPVKGERLADERLSGELTNVIMQLARTDKTVDSALWRVRCFLAPPTSLMHPAILWKALLFKVNGALRLTK